MGTLAGIVAAFPIAVGRGGTGETASWRLRLEGLAFVLQHPFLQSFLA
jgi:hypothetical protein